MKRLVLGAVAVLFMVGCGPSQSAECKKYLACSEAVTAGSTSSLTSSYGPTGTCWTTSTASADACTAACKTALSSLATANPSKTECQ